MKAPEHLNIPESHKNRVVVIGGGFAGINLIRHLVKKKFQIVLFDKNNFHTFQPLLYQVATAGLEPDSVSNPLRKLFNEREDFYFRMIKVQEIDVSNKKIKTIVGDLEYDFLVIATGAATNYFGNNKLAQFSFPLKEVTDALDLRSQLFQNLEKALLVKDKVERQRLMTYVIAGAGPTGVEVAGALAELRKSVLPKDFPELDLNQLRIIVVEGLPQVLPAMSKKSGKAAHKYLIKLGVEVKLNVLIDDYDGYNVKLKTNETIPSRTLIWAAGVKGNFPSSLPKPSIEKGKIRVNQFNQVLTENNFLTNVFAIGDVALFKESEDDKGMPALAPVAIQQGRHLAKNINRMGQNKPLMPFRFKNKGVLATIGRSKAVADLPYSFVKGFFGWLVWVFVHLYYLIGFRNKLIVISNWLWNYIKFDNGIRLIIRPVMQKDNPVANQLAEEKEEARAEKVR